MEINQMRKQALTLDKVEKAQQDFEENLMRDLNLVEIMQSGGKVQELQYNNLRVIRCKHYGCFCVLDDKNNAIVPIYKYSFIDGFDSGYARVNVEDKSSGTKKWGIINTKGEEVVPLEYDQIWNFYDKDWESVRLEIGDETYWFDLIDGTICDTDPWYKRHHRSNDYYDEQSNEGFRIEDCYDYEGNFDEERFEDAILDGEYVPEDW